MSPNDYTRADVIKLARVIDPQAWAALPVGQDINTPEEYERASKSIRLAATVLVANYRDCTL